MANYNRASFAAYPREGVSDEQVEQALRPLLGYLATSLRPGSVHGVPANIWFDGNEVGCEVSGDHGWDFKDMFDQACAQLAELCDDAFESTVIDDDAGSEEDRTIDAIWSPNESAYRRRKIERSLEDVQDALLGLRLVQPAGLNSRQVAAAQSVSVVSRNGSREARVVMTLDLEALEVAGLDAKQKQAFADQVAALAALFQEWSAGEVGVLERADTHQVVDLSDMETARMALPTSRAWELCPQSSDSSEGEFHFRGVADPSVRHVVRVRDGVVVDEERAEARRRRETQRG